MIDKVFFFLSLLLYPGITETFRSIKMNMEVLGPIRPHFVFFFHKTIFFANARPSLFDFSIIVYFLPYRIFVHGPLRDLSYVCHIVYHKSCIHTSHIIYFHFQKVIKWLKLVLNLDTNFKCDAQHVNVLVSLNFPHESYRNFGLRNFVQQKTFLLTAKKKKKGF